MRRLTFVLLFISACGAYAASTPAVISAGTQTFAYTIAGKPLGTLHCTYRWASPSHDRVQVDCRLRMNYAALTPGGATLELDSQLTTDLHAVPSRYTLTARVAGGVQHASCSRQGDQ